jgi:hypothetical protein
VTSKGRKDVTNGLQGCGALFEELTSRNEHDFKELIISWRASDGYQPIFKAMDDWKIDTDDFLDLQKDPKGVEVRDY